MMDMQEIIRVAENVLHRRIVMANKQNRYEAAHLFIELQEGLSATIACTADNMSELWERYRENEHWVSLIMDASAEWRFRSGLRDDAWEELITLMSESLTIVHTEPQVADRMVADTALTDRLVSQPAILNLLRANQWFVFVVVISWCKAIVNTNVVVETPNHSNREGILEEVLVDGKS